MKTDIRQVLELVEDAGYGYVLVEEGKPQSSENWRIDSFYEFESDAQKLSLIFTIDPLPGYLSAEKNTRSKQQSENTLDTVQIAITDNRSGKREEREFSMRGADIKEIAHFIRFTNFE